MDSSNEVRCIEGPDKEIIPERRNSPLHPSSIRPAVVSCRAETVLLAASGDVIQCRCQPPSKSRVGSRSWGDELAGLCCEARCDDWSPAFGESSAVCGWQQDRTTTSMPHGLVGGSPAQIAPLPHVSSLDQGHPMKDVTPNWQRNRKSGTAPGKVQIAFRSPPLDQGVDDESIVQIRSFDYSHFAEGNNDMLSQAKSQKSSSQLRQSQASDFFHGIPMFSVPFAHIRVAQLSAHALGSHVLLISDAGLLYSYGSNSHGQLGIGTRNPVPVSSPSIVTPLVENGGKAISCAAGVRHSLVVVATESQRLLKQDHRRSKERKNAEWFTHHQMYGFGQNEYMKIGLVQPRSGSQDEDENICLPRRVALRCRVESGAVGEGILTIRASADHSAAIVRKSSGDVELYSWGNASHGALGLPPDRIPATQGDSMLKIVPLPSCVPSLSYKCHDDPPPSSLLLQQEYPTDVSLGERCSFVTTSLGRCFAFGFSEDGMLGLAKSHTEQHLPREIEFPSVGNKVFVSCISAGGAHTVATTNHGEAYAWGNRVNVGVQSNDDDPVQWIPRKMVCPSQSDEVFQAVAGFDNVVLVVRDGRVLSTGVGSGRLGQGVTTDMISAPSPMFGGLQLFISH